MKGVINEMAKQALAGTIKLLEVQEAGTSAPKFKGFVFTEGITVGKDKYYTRAAVELAAKEGVFNGVPMYINHSTEREDYERPERDIRDMVGKILTTWVQEINGKVGLAFEAALHGSPTYTVEALRSWLKGMLEAQAFPETSQHSWIEGQATEIEGYPVFRVDHIAKAESLDFVTRGNAGGVIEAAESVSDAAGTERKNKKTTEGGTEMDIKEILEALKSKAEVKEAVLKALAPDFKAQTKESEALKEAQESLKAAIQAKEAAEAKIEAMELAKHKESILSAAKLKVSEAKLPEPVAERVMESVSALAITKESKPEEIIAGVETVIAKEKEYIDKLSKVQVFGNGESATEVPDSMETEEAIKRADEILSGMGIKKEQEEK